MAIDCPGAARNPLGGGVLTCCACSVLAGLIAVATFGYYARSASCMEGCRTDSCWETKLRPAEEDEDDKEPADPSFMQLCGNAGEECTRGCGESSGVVALRTERSQCQSECFHNCHEKEERTKRLLSESEHADEHAADGGDVGSHEEEEEEDHEKCWTECAEYCQTEKLTEAEAKNVQCLKEKLCDEIYKEQMAAFDDCMKREGCDIDEGAGTFLLAWKVMMLLVPAAGCSLGAFVEVQRWPRCPEDCNWASVVGRGLWAIGTGMLWYFGYLQLATMQVSEGPGSGWWLIISLVFIPYLVLPACLMLCVARCCLKAEADKDTDDGNL